MLHRRVEARAAAGRQHSTGSPLWRTKTDHTYRPAATARTAARSSYLEQLGHPGALSSRGQRKRLAALAVRLFRAHCVAYAVGPESLHCTLTVTLRHTPCGLIRLESQDHALVGSSDSLQSSGANNGKCCGRQHVGNPIFRLTGQNRTKVGGIVPLIIKVKDY